MLPLEVIHALLVILNSLGYFLEKLLVNWCLRVRNKLRREAQTQTVGGLPSLNLFLRVIKFDTFCKDFLDLFSE